MTKELPITPPPELVVEWWNKCTATSDNLIRQFATQAARWGADQELEACVQWIKDNCYSISVTDHLRAARRPKPPSLREQALAALDEAVMSGDCITVSDALPAIRRALESLPD